MSSTTIHVFGVAGLQVDEVKFRNGNTAPCLWQYLWKKYMSRPATRVGAYHDPDGAFYMDGHEVFPSGDTPRLSEFWKLHKDSRLTWFERLSLRSTYDHVVVRRADFRRLADAFVAFTTAHVPAGATHVWHLPGYVEVLRRLADDEQVLGIGWTQTSVSDMFVGKHTDESEEDPHGEYLPYDLNTREEHWFMELEGDEVAPAEPTKTTEPLPVLVATPEVLGFEVDERCGRDGCDGVLEPNLSGLNCSCHLSPPCSPCENAGCRCPECGWDWRDEK